MASIGDIFGNTTDPPEIVYEGDHEVLVTWALICAFSTLFAFGIATLKFVCDTYYSPANKHKRLKKMVEARKDKEKSAVRAVKRRLVSTEEFRKVYKLKKKDMSLTIEVRAIVLNQAVLNKTVATSKENILKNFAEDVVTGDESRVVLGECDSDGGDYINASFITGYLGDTKHYIASQGPMTHADCENFWQMVWQERVTCIVMAMGLFQQTSMRCQQYWAHHTLKTQYMRYGRYMVRPTKTDITTNLIKRTLILHKDGESDARTITHLEFLSWDDDESSVDPSLYLACRHHARMEHKSGPLLVHCRCGGSKTAMFIALDYCLEQIDDWRCVDIYGAVLHLRQYRANMIRTISQYRAIYDAVSLYICTGHTIIPYTDLPTITERMSVKDHHTAATSFQSEFKLIGDLYEKRPTQGTAGHHIDNRGKCRRVMMQPDDQFRPYLNSADNDDDTDYINAVYIDGFRYNNSYIVTEWPVKQSINSFWRLVYDHKIYSVVLLDYIQFTRKYPRFWPQTCSPDVSHGYGPFAVRYRDCVKTAYYTIRVFTVCRIPKMKTLYDVMHSEASEDGDTEERVVKMFHLRGWRSRDTSPRSPKPLMFLYDAVEEWQKTTDIRSPVCVVSKDGYRRSGMFITIHIGSEALQEHGEVDIFNTVRVMKKRRRKLVYNEVSEKMFNLHHTVIHLMLVAYRYCV